MAPSRRLILFFIAVTVDVFHLCLAGVILTIEGPGVQQTTAEFDYVGIETFDSLRTGVTSRYVTNFGGAPDIQATYTNLRVYDRDIFGGAHGTGKYPVAFKAGASSSAQYSIDFTRTGEKGINYFGYWLSALDPGNSVKFFYENSLIFQLYPQDILDMVQNIPAYWGNPTVPEPGTPFEAFAFVNFFCDDCLFDKIVFEQLTAPAGYESDNHTVGWYTSSSGSTVCPPETSTSTTVTIPLGGGLLPLGLASAAILFAAGSAGAIYGLTNKVSTDDFHGEFEAEDKDIEECDREVAEVPMEADYS